MCREISERAYRSLTLYSAENSWIITDSIIGDDYTAVFNLYSTPQRTGLFTLCKLRAVQERECVIVRDEGPKSSSETY
jgi:hypothetical protein